MVHVAEQLHEVAPQRGHDVGGVGGADVPRQLNGQAAHHAALVVERNKERAQALRLGQVVL